MTRARRPECQSFAIPIGGFTVPGDYLAPGGHVPVHGEWLGALAIRVQLRRTEWRVIAIVLSSPCPVSASSIAKRLSLDYGLVKRVVRELVQWNILERTPAGLAFQPDHERWGPPAPRSVNGGVTRQMANTTPSISPTETGRTA